MSQPTSTAGHGICIERVTKVYAAQPAPAVDDVSLEIAAGEFMTFLGPSGSGKTTMLNLVAGFIGLTAGRVSIDGHDVTALKPHKRNLGVVFQQYALFPHMSVADNVAFPLRRRRVRRQEIDARVREALALVRLEQYAERSPKQLSGGQQQRVALARAVVYEPRALLMDEPLGALDKKLRDQLQREIARMHKELGMTFIFVTHDQHEALTLADRIAVFNDGRVEQVGTPTELYERPATLFVAQFLGESNLFKGTMRRATQTLTGGPAELQAPTAAARLDGMRCVAVVRPERLCLCASADEVPHGHNSVAALVTDLVYVGTHHQIGLTLPDGSRGMAMCVAGSALSATPGEPVIVSWDPQHQAVVPDPAGEPAVPVGAVESAGVV